MGGASEVLKASSALQKSITSNGVRYELYDIFSYEGHAIAAAKKLRGKNYPLEPGFRCRAVVVDFGDRTGLPRYGIFIAKGPKRD